MHTGEIEKSNPQDYHGKRVSIVEANNWSFFIGFKEEKRNVI